MATLPPLAPIQPVPSDNTPLPLPTQPVESQDQTQGIPLKSAPADAMIEDLNNGIFPEGPDTASFTTQDNTTVGNGVQVQTPPVSTEGSNNELSQFKTPFLTSLGSSIKAPWLEAYNMVLKTAVGLNNLGLPLYYNGSVNAPPVGTTQSNQLFNRSNANNEWVADLQKNAEEQEDLYNDMTANSTGGILPDLTRWIAGAISNPLNIMGGPAALIGGKLAGVVSNSLGEIAATTPTILKTIGTLGIKGAVFGVPQVIEDQATQDNYTTTQALQTEVMSTFGFPVAHGIGVGLGYLIRFGKAQFHVNPFDQDTMNVTRGVGLNQAASNVAPKFDEGIRASAATGKQNFITTLKSKLQDVFNQKNIDKGTQELPPDVPPTPIDATQSTKVPQFEDKQGNDQFSDFVNDQLDEGSADVKAEQEKVQQKINDEQDNASQIIKDPTFKPEAEALPDQVQKASNILGMDEAPSDADNAYVNQIIKTPLFNRALKFQNVPEHMRSVEQNDVLKLSPADEFDAQLNEKDNLQEQLQQKEVEAPDKEKINSKINNITDRLDQLSDLIKKKKIDTPLSDSMKKIDDLHDQLNEKRQLSQSNDSVRLWYNQDHRAVSPSDLQSIKDWNFGKEGDMSIDTYGSNKVFQDAARSSQFSEEEQIKSLTKDVDELKDAGQLTQPILDRLNTTEAQLKDATIDDPKNKSGYRAALKMLGDCLQELL